MMSRLQASWDARAAANFMLGGAGAGLIAFSPFIASPHATALGLLLIAAGLGAVWLEIGRKRRALHVFFNPFTSWMTRESFAALLVFPLGLGALLVPAAAPFAALAALAFLYCQARILRAAKGIPAWRAPQVVPLVVFTGLAEGAALGMLFGLEPALLFPAVVARAIAWFGYQRAVRSKALEAPGVALAWAGTVLPVVLVLVAAPLAGLAALATGWWLKLALVTRASLNQGFALPHLPVRGARSGGHP